MAVAGARTEPSTRWAVAPNLLLCSQSQLRGAFFIMAPFLHDQHPFKVLSARHPAVLGRSMEASGLPSAALLKSKSAEVGKRRDGLFVCPCSICAPKPIDPLAPRKSGSSDNSNCVFMEPPPGTLPPPPSVEQSAKEVIAGETVKVSVASKHDSITRVESMIKGHPTNGLRLILCLLSCAAASTGTDFGWKLRTAEASALPRRRKWTPKGSPVFYRISTHFWKAKVASHQFLYIDLHCGISKFLSH